ncbi:ATP-grasp domain-containing protein [Cellulomonas sp. URHD0024]|uniref:ATP-grasp domain-containing protein n=1 Tax=Cellulomonas sp. URHD0024 TaxID=1302620 RepID=UPI00042229CF|nr:ATP-grasp domain-containing protein [Cellulomonas sp. URHD0024]
MLLLLPADPLNPRSCDPHFAPEARAARDLGIDVAFVDHDALCAGAAGQAVARVPGSDDAVYRGWMLRGGEYAAFEHALGARGVALRTSAAAFRTAHELPGWYAALSDLTPQTVWSTGGAPDEVAALCAALGTGGAVLRDYVKSMKHYWDEACFIPDVTDIDTATRVAARFVELREDSLTGGLVLRRFEHFRGAEVRTWWIDGRCALATAHPDTADELPGPELVLPDLGPTVTALGLGFVTVDLARREDGVWRVIELGDGQVSDRPTSTSPEDLVGALVRHDAALG